MPADKRSKFKVKKYYKTFQLGALALISSLVLSIPAQAGVIVISGDGNIIPQTQQSDNATFFNNLLGNGTNVAVQGNRLISSWSSTINRYYNNQAGVSSSVIQGRVN